MTRNKKLLGAPGIATRSKDATRSKKVCSSRGRTMNSGGQRRCAILRAACFARGVSGPLARHGVHSRAEGHRGITIEGLVWLPLEFSGNYRGQH